MRVMGIDPPLNFCDPWRSGDQGVDARIALDKLDNGDRRYYDHECPKKFLQVEGDVE
jgi:hypothetical protein